MTQGSAETASLVNGKQIETDTGDRAALLQDAANSAADNVGTLYLAFLSFGAYLAVAFGAITDEQLLRSNTITLPILGADIGLRGFLLDCASAICFISSQFAYSATPSLKEAAST
jgi:hypothetical protein